MQSDLAAFLARHTPCYTEPINWGHGAMPLELTSYVGDEVPPLDYLTSVRSLVFRDDLILVMRNIDGTHIWPGGRREANETLEQTLRREIREEAAWEIDNVAMLGFLHYHHLNPPPPNYPWPYPDFLQLIFASKAIHSTSEALPPDDFELEARWLPIAEAQQLPLTLAEQLFLEAALARQ